MELIENIAFRNSSTFDIPRLFSSPIPTVPDTSALCSIITFLATVQSLQIPFLQITWQSRRPLAGKGGSS
ncbi:hypothetical protein F5Y10DRAFT_252029 [Nemania abortiva]|nr:hypothetical protein F5Y10DRAFT_252029 [Nemania abortiva]